MRGAQLVLLLLSLLMLPPPPPALAQAANPRGWQAASDALQRQRPQILPFPDPPPTSPRERHPDVSHQSSDLGQREGALQQGWLQQAFLAALLLLGAFLLGWRVSNSQSRERLEVMAIEYTERAQVCVDSLCHFGGDTCKEQLAWIGEAQFCAFFKRT